MMCNLDFPDQNHITLLFIPDESMIEKLVSDTFAIWSRLGFLISFAFIGYLTAGDVLLQFSNGKLLIGDELSDNIAQRDDTDQPIILQNRQMTDVFGCH
jgi:hypothetical protein